MSDRQKNPLIFARLLMSMCSPSQMWMMFITMITALFVNTAIIWITNSFLWVNPDFYGTYLVKPLGATHLEVKVEPPEGKLRLSLLVSASYSWRNVPTEAALYALAVR